MSIKGKTVWAFRTGIHYEGSTVHSIYETLDGACAAAQEFMEKENDADRHFGTPQEWEYEEKEDGGRSWEGDVYWVAVQPYEIK